MVLARRRDGVAAAMSGAAMDGGGANQRVTASPGAAGVGRYHAHMVQPVRHGARGADHGLNPATDAAAELPEALSSLRALAVNLRWSWHRPTIEVFRQLDGSLWERTGHNPVRMLADIGRLRLAAAAADPAFVAEVERQAADLDAYLARPRRTDMPEVGYFSAEFGITECLQIYSGGLGILAGDHLKAASDRSLPLTGVSLLYREGYFRQRLTEDGRQQELYEDAQLDVLPITRARDAAGRHLTVTVPYPGRLVTARVWTAAVGQVSLHLLDTADPDNAPEDRWIAQHLYGGDIETRLRQEIMLGIGGYRALRALGIDCQRFHMNEGHSAFLALEHVRRFVEDDGLSFEAARDRAARDLVFTTHTPVAAGHDYFPPELLLSYLGEYPTILGITPEEFLGLGRRNPSDKLEPFCMTVLALRLSARANGVSRLHGDVSREMWQDVFPTLPEVPIGHVTNGVHYPTFVSGDLAALFDRWLGTDWRSRPEDPEVWARVGGIPDDELWRVRGQRRERLVAFARDTVHHQYARRDATPAELAKAADVLDARALTIGFARRFATYKRGSLVLSSPTRLKALLTNPARPVQLIVAGKAHPRDEGGKELIRLVASFATNPLLRRRLVFLEDYDTAIARQLVQGCDVWLNTPRRPHEACGTSGMKAMVNGGLNLSTLDGWWDEAWLDRDPDGTPFGWSIEGRSFTDERRQDREDAAVLYRLLEREVVPRFFDRDDAGVPRAWIAMVKSALANLAPVFTAHRMVDQYADEYYRPPAPAPAPLVPPAPGVPGVPGVRPTSVAAPGPVDPRSTRR
jgi:glycogen phosphorylase